MKVDEPDCIGDVGALEVLSLWSPALEDVLVQLVRLVVVAQT